MTDFHGDELGNNPSRPNQSIPQEDDISSFPGVHMAIDLAIFTVSPADDLGGRQLLLLLHRRPAGYREGEWVLPGRFVRERETLAQTARACLREKAGIRGYKSKQVTMLDEPFRDPRGWTMSVGSVVAVPYRVAEEAVADSPSNRTLAVVRNYRIEIPNQQDELPFEQQKVVDEAINMMRDRYYRKPDPWKFLGDVFTLSELRSVHDAVLDKSPYSRDSFRRTMTTMLEATGELERGAVGKPAELYRRRKSESINRVPRRIQSFSPSTIASHSKMKPEIDLE
jgi:8-oxo-dGTP diphosphatase